MQLGKFHRYPTASLSRLASATVLSLSVLAFDSASAATQGNIGNTSTGALSISLSVPKLARISKLDDITLGLWSGSGDLSGSDSSICVWTNSGVYSVTAKTENNSGNKFNLRSQEGKLIPYQVQWAQSGNQTSGQQMTPDSPLTGQNTNAESSDCSQGPEATAGLFVKVSEATLSVAGDGSYTDALTLVIAPL
jgi:hypothetical protein